MSSRYIFHIVFFIALTSITVTLAQDKARISLIKYGQSDGLSSYNIRQIIRDKNGFLWIASQDGLNRFDGKTFLSYTSQSLPKYQISGPDVRKLIEDTLRRELWVLPNRDRLNIISTLSGEVIKSIPIPKYSNEDWNITMTACRHKLWIGSFDGLKILNTDNWHFIPSSAIVPALKKAPGILEANCIAKDSFENVWVCYSGYGIVIYNGNTLKQIATVPLSDLNDHLESSYIRVNDYVEIDKNTMMFATNQGLRKISFDRSYRLKVDVAPSTTLPVLNSCSLEAIALTKPNEIMLSGNSHLYALDSALKHYRVYDESIGQAESQWINYVQSIYKDDDKIWLSCQQGVGMVKTNKGPFEKYYFDEQSGNKLEHLRSIMVLSNKDILCGQSNGLMLLRRSDGRLTQLDRLHLYHHMFNDPNRRIWLSRDDGLFILDRTKAILPATSIYPEFKKYKTYTINSHLRLGDSLVVMGTENDQGILLWYYKRRLVKKVDISSAPSLASNSVNNIYLDKRGRLWVLSDKTITVISNTFSKSSFPDFISDQKYTKLSLFFDMCEAMGSYWIASYGNGIIQVNNKGQILKLLSLKDGLSNDGLYNIFNIGDSSLVMTSNNGLSVYHLRNHKFKNYFSENGLHSNGFEEVSSTVDQEKIYAGGINGFTVIDPSRLTTNKKPPLFYYKNVEVKLSNGENSVNTCIAVQKVNIPSNWLQTTISFSGINFDDPKRVDYRYRIKEIDSNWINNGHRDQISLIGLRPETYTLEVKASNEDGFWSQPKSLTLVVKPKWYETWWFKTGIMITVVSVFGLVYRYRIKQVKIQQQIRREIANDLHDDLGSNLNSIKIFTHLALEEKDKNDYLMELHELVGSTLTGLRDMLWVLEDDHDDVNGLVARINKFALPIAGAQQVDFYCFTQGFDTIGLTKKEKRNLFLIIKESINNSFKHAQCSRLTVTIGANKTKITVRVSDNGQGFSYTEKAESYGIRNIIYRATQIGYQAGITSVTGKGTTIVVEKK